MAGRQRSHNLPARLTSFVGRAWEIAEVERLLDGGRLVTLVGAPGVGKTRLALQIAAALAPDPRPQIPRDRVHDAGLFPDGVWLVELAPLAEPTLVPRAVAAALGVREQPGTPLPATLADALHERALLLVLDNCEHLIAASASLAEWLLCACPRVRILATSREPLLIEGEVTVRVPSLPLPPVEGEDDGSVTDWRSLALASEAVRLFVDRASAARPGFALDDASARAAIRVCRRLDGIPLAIELAAARVRGLTVQQIAARLDDRFGLLTSGSRTALPRQRTLRAAVEWSHELLTEPERALLRRLAVFAGGFTPEAAAAVCGFGPGATRTDAPPSARLAPPVVEPGARPPAPARRQVAGASHRR